MKKPLAKLRYAQGATDRRRQAEADLRCGEHAHYIDCRNQRPNYVKAYLGDLLNWEFAARNFA